MDDTICAISTSMGIGAISIVRVSGKDAIDVVNSIFNKDISNVGSHTIHYGKIIDNGLVIDEVLVMIMKAPKTYTREDVVEINSHGGANTTRTILQVLLAHGCRLADPGEFTKRAYLNGRINLIEAESVNDLIVAKTDSARTLAINNMGGKLSDTIRELRDKIGDILSNIEVNIDYPEYVDELEVTHNLMNEYLKDIKSKLESIVEGSKNGKLIKDGVGVAIIGKPNVGKSSILNNLIDEEKAIVTDIPGTTRDIVEGSITLNGVEIKFVDTAGIRDTDDLVESIGVKKSKSTADSADIIIMVLNNNEKIDDSELELINKYNNDNLIIFVNKNDLDSNIDIPDDLSNKVIYGNTLSFGGLDNLKLRIKDVLNLDSIVNKDMSYLCNAREIDLINKARDAIDNAYNSLDSDMPVDIIEIDLKMCWDCLGELLGDNYQDELVDKIFSNFCLGK